MCPTRHWYRMRLGPTWQGRMRELVHEKAFSLLLQHSLRSAWEGTWCLHKPDTLSPPSPKKVPSTLLPMLAGKGVRRRGRLIIRYDFVLEESRKKSSVWGERQFMISQWRFVQVMHDKTYYLDRSFTSRITALVSRQWPESWFQDCPSWCVSLLGLEFEVNLDSNLFGTKHLQV